MLVLCGCGALGSQIAMHLAGPELSFLLIDDDVVEEHNLATSVYMQHHVGAMKAVVLSEMLVRKCRVKEVRSSCRTVQGREVRQLAEGATLVIDTFDNVEARACTQGLGVPTLHVGVAENRTGAVIWDEWYTLPKSRYSRGENPVCTHMLGRPILRFTAAVAARVVERFLETSEKLCYVTTEDMGLYF